MTKGVDIINQIKWLKCSLAAGAVKARDRGLDAVLEIRLGGNRRARLCLQTKRELRPSAFAGWLATQPKSARAEEVSVLGMPFVSPRMIDLCRQAGWGWYDLAGNCRIEIPGLLYLERSGIAAVHRPPRAAANLRSWAAARVLRALLSPAHARRTWTQRSLRDQTSWKEVDGKGLSLGLVNKVVRHLRDEGWVEDSGAGDLRVRDPAGLLAAWSEAYRFGRHERRGYFSLLKGSELNAALYRVGLEAGGLAAYAAFSAAERQARNVRQPTTWLYLDPAFLEAFIRIVQAKEVDSGENLVVLFPVDMGVFSSFEPERYVDSNVLGCTDPVQTYVDLTHAGGRGEEAARALLEQRLLPAWQGGASE